MKYANVVVLNAVPVSTTIDSQVIDLSQIYRFSGQIVVSSGTAACTIQLQVSNDPIGVFYQGLNAPVNWSNLGSPVTISSSGVTLVPYQESCYRSLRVVLTNTGSSTATLTFNLLALCI